MKTSPAPSREDRLPKLQPLETRTLVDQVVDAIVEATATGVFLPGDRIVEAEVARSLNVSRVPVREALRILESQGIVVNARYRGMRLMDVSVDRLEKLLKLRTALETLAAEEILLNMKTDPNVLQPLEQVVADLHAAAEKDDAYGVANLDTQFHRVFCQISGNDVLVHMWETLARQLTIIFGLSTLQKDLASIVEEHDELIEKIKAGDQKALTDLVRTHIIDYSRALDYEGFVENLRKLESRKKAK